MVLTFPVLPGQGPSVHKKPNWATIVAAHASGRESRARRFRWPLWSFELTFEGLDATSKGYYGGIGAQTLQQLAGFYDQLQGAFQPFLYVDPTDFQAFASQIGVADGVTTTFTMLRSIGPFTGPVDVVTSVGAIYLDSVAQASSGWTATNGWPFPQLTFATAPIGGAVVTADFQYAYIVRFSDDVQDFEEFLTRLIVLKQIKFQSVRNRTTGLELGEPIVPLPVTPHYRALIWDDCCHLYLSDDLGAHWAESETPTLQGDWTDLPMAILDGDYTSMLAFVNAFLGNLYESRANLSLATGATGSWTDINPTSPASAGTASHYQEFYYGAISANATIQIALPPVWVDSALSYPRISYDQGAHWADITAVGSGHRWSRACFNQGASIMYMVSGDFSQSDILRFWGSFDTGAHWSALTAPPTGAPTLTAMNAAMLRTSADGNTLLYVSNWDGWAYISRDRGAHWTTVDLPLPSATTAIDWYNNGSQYACCGMSPDGLTMIVVFGGQLYLAGGYLYDSYVAISRDGGNTWTFTLTPGVRAAHTSGSFAAVCNVSPDGLAFLIGFSSNYTDVYSAEISTDGVTFTTSNGFGTTIIGNTITACYLTQLPPT